jgi:hypothetical protein
MPRYLISFEVGAMTFPPQDLPEVGRAAHAVVAEAKEAGVWIHGGGIEDDGAEVVAADGTVTHTANPPATATLSGFSILSVPTRDEAHAWAARFAAACRCAQEVRELMEDPEV